MQAVWIPKYGKPDVFEVREEIDPTPGRGEVRIRVRASGINFADVMARQGLYPDAPAPPLVIGYEVSGVIDAVGEGVSERSEGQRVLAMTRFGGYADTVCVNAADTYVMPDGMTFEEIGDVCGIPGNTAASRFRYGIDKMRRQLRPLYEEIRS